MPRKCSLNRPPREQKSMAGMLVLFSWLVPLVIGGVVFQGCQASSPDSDSASPEKASPQQKASPQKTSAQIKWETLFKDDPENYEEFKSIQEEFRNANHEEAIRRLEVLLQNSPDEAWAEAVELQLIQILRLMQDYPRALQQLDLFLERHSDSPTASKAYIIKGEIFIQQARQLKGSGREFLGKKNPLNEAVSVFLEIPKKYPEDTGLQAQALYHLGLAYMTMEDRGRAEEVLRRLADGFADTPYPPKALYVLASIYLSEADTVAARKAMEELVERFPDKQEGKKAKKNLMGIRLVGQKAPESEIKEWIGEPPPELGADKEKVRLLSFWAIWCPHCRKNIPKISLLQQSYGSKGLRIVGISREREGKGADKIRAYVDDHPMGFSTGVDDDGKTSKAYSISNIPRVVAIDAQGIIRWHGHPDYLTNKVVETLLDEGVE